MQIERRALYNLMRLNWLHNPNMPVEPWQVEDYRTMPLETIFERLRFHDIEFEKGLFIDLAADYDSPEDFTDAVLAEFDADTVTQDQIYLLLFELWRRLLPEKPCLSVFCDELDHQIHLYDSGNSENTEEIQDVVANLQVILDENIDEGADPLEVFESICGGCANDVESFLYDYISDQIESDHLSYAADLLDGFNNYVSDVKWFDFLRARHIAFHDQSAANELVPQLIQDSKDTPDLEFNLELLSFLVQGGEKGIFVGLVRKTLPLLQTEGDFQDLLAICIDFFHRLDCEKEEDSLQKLLRKRSHLHLEGVVNSKDPQINELLHLLE